MTHKTATRRYPKALRRAYSYFSRLWRWVDILRQVRGEGLRDQLVLLESAVYAIVASFRGLDSWQDPILLRDAAVRVSGIGHFHVRKRCDDLWHVFPDREPAVLGALKERLSEGDVFVDAGANVGVYTVMAARQVGESGQVIAIEMMPDTAAILRRHVEKNGLGNITIIEKALSSTAGETLSAWVSCGKYGQATLSESERLAGSAEVAVKTTTLNDALANVNRVRVMKMDLEGAERNALSGANAVLERIDSIVFESHDGSTPCDVFLSERGFSIHSLDGANRVATRGDSQDRRVNRSADLDCST